MIKKNKITVLLADDHQIMRDGLKYLLKNEKNFEVVGETSQGRETINQAILLKPDIVVMDINMPNLDGIEATRVITKRLPNTKVLILTAHYEKNIIEQTLKAKAAAYIHKESTFSEFVIALNAVNKEQTYLCPKIRNILVNNYIDDLRGTNLDTASNLTDKEYEIVRLLSLGKTTKEIAYDMDMSSKTVDAYRRNIMTKLNIQSLAELVKFSIKEGIIVL